MTLYLDSVKGIFEEQWEDSYRLDSNLARLLNRGGSPPGSDYAALAPTKAAKVAPLRRPLSGRLKTLIEPILACGKSRVGWGNTHDRDWKKSPATTASNLTAILGAPPAARQLGSGKLHGRMRCRRT